MDENAALDTGRKIRPAPEFVPFPEEISHFSTVFARPEGCRHRSFPPGPGPQKG